MEAPKYTPPLDPELARKVYALDDDAQEFYQERAGIRQFCAGLSRRHAEQAAWEDTVRYLEQRDAGPKSP
ncbi:hypothetical protein [Propionivibrio sp.]|uniref:hypothetical protein n=1 Tax=Propionivibrio sp. TaxID=2212460 RepID=UPI003BF3CBB8